MPRGVLADGSGGRSIVVRVDAIALFNDLVSRPKDALTRATNDLSVEDANAHPGGHPNSITWLLWHTGREIDLQLAHLAGITETQLWDRANVADATGIERGSSELGYGDTPEQAAALRVDTAEQLAALIAYAAAALDGLRDYCASLTDSALRDTIGEYDGEPILRSVRLVSIIDDAQQHIAQIAYIRGMTTIQQ